MAVLAGFHPEGGWWAVAGTMAVVLASLFYAISNLFAQARQSATSPMVLVAGSSLAGLAILAPIALFQLPAEVPSAKALGSVFILGTVGTAFALLLYFRMLQGYGASKASLVTYLIPPFAVAYGVGILDESLQTERDPGAGPHPGRRRARIRRTSFLAHARRARRSAAALAHRVP